MQPARDVFALPDRLAAKAIPELIADDRRHFAAMSRSLEHSVAELTARLDRERRMPGGGGQAALERDLEVHTLAARLRTLRRWGLDLCLGRMVPADGGAAVYVGRLALRGVDGERLLIDWRSPAAEPFFAATLAEPMGLASRRRYRWSGRRITDYWDEALSATGSGVDGSGASLDDQSAFIASLGETRTERMRDVLGTIRSDQDAVIRATSRGALVVDGGPGTGKTVVALHRAAYLLYADQRLRRGPGGVLFVGPTPAYLAYVADVLPGLGEEGVQMSTLRDLAPEGADALPDTDLDATRLKAEGVLVRAVGAAVAAYERPPVDPVTVETEWADVEIGAETWAEAFSAADPALTHNAARDEVWTELCGLAAASAPEAPRRQLRAAIQRDETLRERFSAAWPLLDPAGVVADLWSHPDHLARCAPWLGDHDIRALQRDHPRAWTVADLPLLDAARHRIGDPERVRTARRRDAADRAERVRMDRVVDDLIAAEAADGLASMLSGQDLRNSLVDQGALPALDPETLAGPFAHVVVDEAQELSDAEWGMLLRRCPSRSLTIVGDRAQARAGFPERWEERLRRIGAGEARVSSLRVNYRTPEEVMDEAAPVIRAVLPDANVPVSVRRSGEPVRRGRLDELEATIERWLREHPEGVGAVIGVDPPAPRPRIRSLSPADAKGLEFDLVVLLDPSDWGSGEREVTAGVDRYVAMTRTTRELVILED